MTNIDPDGGAPWKGRKATRLQPSSREIKMLRPICKTCEDAVGGSKFLPPGWQNNCEHDPYISYVEVPQQVPVYEDQDDGSKKLVRTETIVTTVGRPNWVAVMQAKGHNSGRGPDMALRKGFIYPQQLRSPLFPDGISRRCQFRECYEGEGLTKYNSGWFCREVEAKLVRASDTSLVMEVGVFSADSDAKRQKQLEDIKI